MSSASLIFPCYLSDSQFQILQEEKTILQKYLHLKDDPNDKKLSAIRYYIGLAIFELTNIIQQHNLTGYRFNSYALHNVNLKLSFIYELMRKYDPEGITLKATDLANTHYRLELILNTCHLNYMETLT